MDGHSKRNCSKLISLIMSAVLIGDFITDIQMYSNILSHNSKIKEACYDGDDQITVHFYDHYDSTFLKKETTTSKTLDLCLHSVQLPTREFLQSKERNHTETPLLEQIQTNKNLTFIGNYLQELVSINEEYTEWAECESGNIWCRKRKSFFGPPGSPKSCVDIARMENPANEMFCMLFIPDGLEPLDKVLFSDFCDLSCPADSINLFFDEFDIPVKSQKKSCTNVGINGTNHFVDCLNDLVAFYVYEFSMFFPLLNSKLPDCNQLRRNYNPNQSYKHCELSGIVDSKGSYHNDLGSAAGNGSLSILYSAYYDPAVIGLASSPAIETTLKDLALAGLVILCIAFILPCFRFGSCSLEYQMEEWRSPKYFVEIYQGEVEELEKKLRKKYIGETEKQDLLDEIEKNKKIISQAREQMDEADKKIHVAADIMQHMPFYSFGVFCASEDYEKNGGGEPLRNERGDLWALLCICIWLIIQDGFPIAVALIQIIGTKISTIPLLSFLFNFGGFIFVLARYAERISAAPKVTPA